MGELVSCGCGVGSGQAGILCYTILDFFITYHQNVVFYLKYHKHKRIGRAPFLLFVLKFRFPLFPIIENFYFALFLYSRTLEYLNTHNNFESLNLSNLK